MAKQSGAAVGWDSVDGARAALRGGKAGAKTLADAFVWKSEKHVATLLSLLPEERRAVLGSGHRTVARDFGYLAHDLAQKKRFPDALTIFDDLVTLGDLDRTTYCNALWAVMNDNHHLGVMPERARIYLAACVPHGPTNPAIFFNEACVRFELGDVDGAFKAIEQAKDFDYELENIRDEKLLAPLHSDPRWNALFADVDPPSLDLAKAKDLAPRDVRKLELDKAEELSVDLSAYSELEVIELHFSELKAVPASLAKLPRLRKLDLRWNSSLREIPDEVLIMSSLREIEIHGSPLSKKVASKDLSNLVAGFAKAQADDATRRLHLALLKKDEKAARSLGDDEALIRALDSNVGTVRAIALRLLAKALPASALRLASGDSVVIAGKLTSDRATLVERLEAIGVKVAKKVGAKVKAVVLGESPKGAASEVPKSVVIVVEATLLAFLDGAAPQHLTQAVDSDEARDTAARLGELLASEDGASVKLALEMMKKGGVPKPPHGVFEELLCVMQDADADKKSREEAKRLFAVHAPAELQDAVKKVLARKSIYGSGETKVRSRIKALARAAKTSFDPIKFAKLLLPAGVGHTYLFEVGKKDPSLALLALQSLMKGGKLDLSQKEISEVPAAVAELDGLRELDLAGDHLHEISETILSLSGLEVLDVSGNRLEAIPAGISRLKKLRSLDVSSNFIRTFPVEVFGVTSLRSLRVATTRYGAHREIPFSEIPDGIEALAHLEELDLSAHRLAKLPIGLKKLGKLRRLDLGSGQLGSLPAWLAELPSLKEVDLAYTEIASKNEARATADQLKKRGVKVVGFP